MAEQTVTTILAILKNCCQYLLKIFQKKLKKMPEIELSKMSFTRQSLMKCLEEDEIIFVLHLGAALQEVTTQHKLIYMSSQGADNPIERMAENTQGLYFLNILASALHEGWEALTHRKNKPIVDSYRSKLDTQGKEALEKLEEYFSNTKNLCTEIRNNFGFHNNIGKMRDTFQKIPKESGLEIFLAANTGNCRFLASDVITNMAVLETTDLAVIQEKLPDLMGEILEVARWFLDSVIGIISLILIKASETGSVEIEDISLEDVPFLDDLRLRYFVSPKTD